jgi:hypothetical protein
MGFNDFESLDTRRDQKSERLQPDRLSTCVPDLYNQMSKTLNGNKQSESGLSPNDPFIDFGKFNSIYPGGNASDCATPQKGSSTDGSSSDGSSSDGNSPGNSFRGWEKETHQIGQLEKDVTTLDQELQQLQTWLANLENSTTGSTTPPPESTTGSSTPPPESTTGSTPPPVETTPPPGTTPPPVESTPPPTTTPPPVETTPPPTTTPPPVETPPPPTTPPATTTAGPNSAIGPTGEVVGSTATKFGPTAAPEVSPSAQAFYVSADGSSTGNGSAAQPFATLQQAQKAMEGSSIKTTYVEGGNYNMSSALNLTSADSGESFIGIGSSSNPVVLDGEGTTGSIVSINGANNITMEGLTMQNTQKNLFAYTNQDAAVTAVNSTGDNFSYNSMSNVGVAFNLGNVTQSSLDGNAIDNVQQAIQMNPGNNNDTIDSNSITNVANVTGGNQSGAINVEASSNDTFSNNYIANTSAAGIELANWGGVSNNNDTIIGNTVENTNQAATKSSTYDSSGTNPSDMGAIYAWQGVQNNSDQMNLKISNNYVKNSGQGFENVGIYLDDGVSGATVTNNIVVPEGNNGYAALIHGGSNDTFQGNVFDLSSSSGDQHGLLMQSDGPTMSNDIVRGNDFYATTPNGGAYVDYSNPSNNIPQTITDNDYWGVTQSNDSSPVNTNPGFVDPTNGNYSLAAGSTADGPG